MQPSNMIVGTIVTVTREADIPCSCKMVSFCCITITGCLDGKEILQTLEVFLF